MQIEKDKVVAFHDRLTRPGRGVIEDSHDGSPVGHLHGHRGLIKGLEQALEGRRPGERFTATAPPELAYGLPLDDALQWISKSHVSGASRTKFHFKPGMIVQVNTPQGPRSVVVVKVGLKTLDVADWTRGLVARRSMGTHPTSFFASRHDPNPHTVAAAWYCETGSDHSPAGKALTFDVEVVDVRPASDEGIAHGHAHGAGVHAH